MHNPRQLRRITLAMHLHNRPDLSISARGELDAPENRKVDWTRDRGAEWRVEVELHLELRGGLVGCCLWCGMTYLKTAGGTGEDEGDEPYEGS
jgi:hypothetical protein